MAPRIYTRTGDAGTTGIHGGTRVPKDDIRIEANGDLDELNCQIGVIRSMVRCPVKPGMTEIDGDEGAAAGGFLGSGHFFCPRHEKPEQQSPENWDSILYGIQKNLMTMMSLVATPAAEREKNPNALPETLVADCEAQIDALSAEIGPALHFLLPGGTPLAAQLQLARAVCRRAERHLWSLHRADPLPDTILQYINRLSDLLFVMARNELARQDWPEERWKAFAYKNQTPPTGKV